MRPTPPTPALPRRGNAITRAFGRAVLSGLGWRIEGAFPDLPKFVAVGAPHTSNWDFVLTMASFFALGVDARWLAKHTLFLWPLGSLFRWMGGIPVNRGIQSGVVGQSVKAFDSREGLILCIAPEGTRSGAREWRTGFYHIATGARVPVVPCSVDYATRVIRIGQPLDTTGDLEADLAQVRAFYRGVKGKNSSRRPEVPRPHP